MATSLKAKPGTGGDPDLKFELIGGIYVPTGKIYLGADGVDDGPVSAANPLPARGFETTVSVDIIRPSNTNTYTADDAWAATTPAANGSDFANCARASGKGGVILSAVIASSANPALKLAGKLYLFDSNVTAIADADPFTVTDAEAKTAVAEIDFTLNSFGPTSAGNSIYFAKNLNYAFTTVGSAGLRGLVRVMNAYIPISGEVLTARLQIVQLD